MNGPRVVSSSEFSKTLFVLAASLIAIDVALILISVAGVLLELRGYIDDVPFRLLITQDWSFGEMWNYLKWMSIVVLCLLAWRMTRSPLFTGFGVAFAVLLFDDMLQLHERGGAALVSRFDIQSIMGLRAQDFGELFIWGFLGVIVLAAIFLGFRFARRQDRGAGLALLAVLAGLVFCGVVVDMAAIVVGGQLEDGLLKKMVVWSLHLVEDGGEMVVGSLGVALAAATFASLRSRPDMPPVTFWPEPHAARS